VATHSNGWNTIILAAELGELGPRGVDLVLCAQGQDLIPEPVSNEFIICIGTQTGYAAR